MIVCVYFSSYFFFLSYRFRLIVHLTDDPRARLSSYATTGNQLATSDESLDKLIELIIATTDKLISAFHQVRNWERERRIEQNQYFLIRRLARLHFPLTGRQRGPLVGFLHGAGSISVRFGRRVQLRRRRFEGRSAESLFRSEGAGRGCGRGGWPLDVVPGSLAQRKSSRPVCYAQRPGPLHSAASSGIGRLDIAR